MSPSAMSSFCVGRWRSLRRSIRQARYLWLNRGFLRDVTLASLAFLVVFFGSLLIPARPAIVIAGWWPIVVGFSAVLTFCTAIVFWRVRRYLIGVAAFEDLRASKRPGSGRALRMVLRFPCTWAVGFAALTGFALASWLGGDWGVIRSSLLLVVEPALPVGSDLRCLVGDAEEAPWPCWVGFVLPRIYVVIVFALVSAWYEQGRQRQGFVASLFTEEDRPASPFGSARASTAGTFEREAHEQVLLMRAERIGAESLPYLRVELSAPEQSPAAANPDRCRGAVAVLREIFQEGRGGTWERHPRSSAWVRGWLLEFLGHQLDRDVASHDEGDDYAIGEAVRSLAAMIAASRPTVANPPGGGGIAGPLPDVEGRFRGQLRVVFARSGKRPELLISACEAAERLGTEDDLRLLDEQTRRLDVQAGFTIEQTDRILIARDRVLAREPLRTTALDGAIRQAVKLGLERISGPEGCGPRFRRPRDSGIMALVPAGSFIRGSDAAEDTSPRRRIHLGVFLIDVDPVPQGSFTAWMKDQGGVLRLERGFFPVQSLPEEIPHDLAHAAYVTWFAAQAYAAWAIEGDPGGRLPSEAQWEKAARGIEDERRFPGGDQWSTGATESPYGVRMCQLIEWTSDSYDRLAYRHSPAVFDPRMESPSRDAAESPRAARGRRPDQPTGDYSLTNRQMIEPITGALILPVGFRVVVDLEPGGAS